MVMQHGHEQDGFCEKGCPVFDQIETHDAMAFRLLEHRTKAEVQGWKALSGYKFQMFGYWVGIWGHLNQIIADGHGNPWTDVVKLAKAQIANLEAISQILSETPEDSTQEGTGE